MKKTFLTMKKTSCISLCLILVLLCTSAFQLKAQTERGTADRPYTINSLAQLEALAQGINSTSADGFYYDSTLSEKFSVTIPVSGHGIAVPRGGHDVYFRLTADIVSNVGNLAGCDGVDDGYSEWTPIGSGSQAFEGHFDGGNHYISGLYINNNSTAIGLFGKTTGATIHNLALTNSYFKGKRYVGGLVGWATNTNIDHCFNTATIVGEGDNIGGITGGNTVTSGTYTIAYCYNTGYVHSYAYNAGGISGMNFGSVISHCYNAGTVEAPEQGNAIAGVNDNGGDITDCYYDNFMSGGAFGNGVQTNAFTRATWNLLGSEFTFSNGLYPRLACFSTTNAALSNFSAIPVILSGSDYFSNVYAESFSIGTAASATWTSSNTIRATISGSTVTQIARGHYLLCATNGNFGRCVALTSCQGAAIGTETNPKTISTAAELITLRDGINSGTGFVIGLDSCNALGNNFWFELDNDIDINPEQSADYAAWDANNKPAVLWTSIGTATAPFQGHFNGGGHTIAGIYGESLFGVVNNEPGTDGASISNVGLIRSYVSSGSHFGYVSDGLVMHYDGIQNTRAGHNPTAMVWEDLAGNYDLKILRYANPTWGDDHFFGISDTGFLDPGIHNYFLYNTTGKITVEFVTYIDCDRTSPAFRGILGYNNGQTMIQNNAGEARMTTLGSLDVTSADDQIATCAYSMGIGSFLNGSWQTGTTSGLVANTSYAPFGFGNSYGQSDMSASAYDGCSPNRGWNDSIYAIRVYNRALSGAELAKNHAIDYLRFITKKGGGYAGSLVSINLGGTISNCYSAANVTEGAGLVGYNTGTISNCFYAGSLSGELTAGLVAMNTQDGIISNSYCAGSTDAKTMIGGYLTNVSNCHFDNQMAPNATSNAQCTGHATNDMLGSSLSLGAEYTYIPDYYPMLTVADATDAAMAISSPIFLSGSDDVEHITANITLGGSDYFADWAVVMGRGLQISSDIATLTATPSRTILEVGLNGQVYKDISLTVGNAAFIVDNMTTLTQLRNLINAGASFYYNPTSHEFASTKSETYCIKVNALGEGQLFTLASDLDMGGTGWQPIGTTTNPFRGTFDGANFTITGLKLATSSMASGLFGYSQGTIKNINVESPINNSSNYFLGTICGVNNGTIDNCKINNHTNSNTGFSRGSICGANFRGTIRNCSLTNTTWTASGNSFNGGLCGYSTGLIEDCFAQNNQMNATANAVGGIVGASWCGEIRNCHIEGGKFNINSNNTFYGGIVGLANYSNIDNCYNHNCPVGCSIEGKQYGQNVGGLVGALMMSRLTNSYNNGGHVLNTYSRGGGLVGGASAWSYIGHCYNTANVESNNTAGGIAAISFDRVEYCYNTGNITQSSNIISASSYNAAGGIVGFLCIWLPNQTEVNYNSYKRAVVEHCINTGTITALAKERAGQSQNWGQASGVVGESYGSFAKVNYCINAGEVIGHTYSGAHGITYNTSETVNSKASYCYNIGKVSGGARIEGVAVSSDGLSGEQYLPTACFYDQQLNPYVTRRAAFAKNTAEMLGSALQGQMGDDANWVFTPGMYPRINGMEDFDVSIAAATPLTLSGTEVSNAVQSNFTTGTGTTEKPVVWTVVENDNVVSISGNDYSVAGRGPVTLAATRDGKAYKTVELEVGMTRANPFLIDSYAELKNFRDCINNDSTFYYDAAAHSYSLHKTSLASQPVPAHGEGAYFKLTSDIDMLSEQWTPIAFKLADFMGHFDGANHSISNLNITTRDNKNWYNYGLFGNVLRGGSLKNIKMVDPHVEILDAKNFRATDSIRTTAGALAGSCGAPIDSCSVTGGLIKGFYAGGLVGRFSSGLRNVGHPASLIDTNLSIRHCSSNTTVIGTANAGGIAGYIYLGGLIRDCYNMGSITGGFRVGGIAGGGYNYLYQNSWGAPRGTISNCYNVGEVSAMQNSDDYRVFTGGIAGVCYKIDTCYNQAKISGSKSHGIATGGIAGWCYTVNYCYNVGEIAGNNSIFTGGVHAVYSFASDTYVPSYYNNYYRNYNAGRVTSNGKYIYPVTANNTQAASNFFDAQMCPNVAAERATTKTTMQMVGNGLKSLLGEAVWVYTDSLYPQLKCFTAENVKSSDEFRRASIASVTPIYLPEGKSVVNVSDDFELGPNTNTMPVLWRLNSGSGLTVEQHTDNSYYGHLTGQTGIATIQDSIDNIAAYKKIRIILVSAENPLIIKNVAQLDTFRRCINSGNLSFYRYADSTFTLVDHIGSDEYMEIPSGGEDVYFKLKPRVSFDLASIPSWTPIGNEEKPFKGNFNGSAGWGNSVDNMRIDSVGSNLGFFGYNAGKVDSLVLKNAVITDKAVDKIGALAGSTLGGFTNCSSINGQVVASGTRVGGLFGQTTGSEIKNCAHIKGTVHPKEGTNKSYYGGLSGYADNTVWTSCHNDSSTVSAYAYVGGITAWQNWGRFDSCYTVGGSLTATRTGDGDAKVAGLAGWIQTDNNANSPINYCHNEGTTISTRANWAAGIANGSNTFEYIKYTYNTANVTARTYAAGIYNTGSLYSNLRYCYNTGNITATASNGYAGGITGYPNTSNIRYTFNTGNITGGYASGITLRVDNGSSSGYDENTYGGQVRYSFNSGIITAKTNWAVGIADGGQTQDRTYSNYNVGAVTGVTYAAGLVNKFNTSKSFNAGRISGQGEFLPASISAQSAGIDCYNDKQMNPGTMLNDGATSLKTTELTGTAMQSALGTNDWIYEENMYPRFKWTDTISARYMPHAKAAGIVASTPIFLPTSPIYMDVNNVSNDFTLGNVNNADLPHSTIWSLEKGSGLTVDMSTASAHVTNIGIAYIQAAYGGTADTIYKNIRILNISLDNPVVIKDYTEFKNFRDAINTGAPFYYNREDRTFTTADMSEDPRYFEIPAGGDGVHFSLLTDINLSDATNWTPIGSNTTGSNRFRGYFEGNGHTVSNLAINNNKDYQGLFGFVQGGTVTNLYLANADVKGKQYVGALCGYSNFGDISLIAVDDESSVQGQHAGGIVGYNYDGVISRSYNMADVTDISTTQSFVGGICSFGTVQDCYNTGDVKGNTAATTLYVGGITGCGTATRCYNLGNVSSGVNVGTCSGMGTFTASYSDIQMLPDLSYGGTNKATAALTGSALESTFGNESWVYSDSLYPRIAGLENSDLAKAYAQAIFLKTGQTVNGVRSHFPVSSAYGVTWDREDPTTTALNISDINTTHKVRVVECGLDNLRATVGSKSKVINIEVDRLEVTTFEAYTCGEPYHWTVNDKYYTRKGTYTETFVTDKGCDSVVTLILNLPEPVDGLLSPTQVTCKDAADGTLDAQMTGGFGEGFIYTWTKADDATYTGNTKIVDHLAPGTYTVLVQDALHNECQKTLTESISEPAKLVAEMGDYGTECSGDHFANKNRYVDLNITGGTKPYTVSWTGSATGSRVVAEPGDVTLNNFGAGTFTITVTDNNNCTHEFEAISFENNATEYTVTAKSVTKVYDGIEVVANTYELKANSTVLNAAIQTGKGYELKETTEYKDSLFITLSTVTRTNAGTESNNITDYRVKRHYLDGTTPDEDVWCLYDINLVNGTVDIAKRNVILTSASASKVFDSTPLTAETVTVTGDGWAGEAATFSNFASITAAGSTPNTFDITYPADYSTDNYNVTILNGTLVVTSSSDEIVFTAPSASKVYDGTPLTDATVTTNLDIVTYRFVPTMKATSTITNAGSVANEIESVTIYNRSTSEDVTSNFTNITMVNGTLTITKREVSLTSQSAEKVYDGTALARPTVTMNGTFVAADVTADAEATGTITTYGTIDNAIDFHPSASFLADNYTITKNEGTLKINKRDVSLNGESLTIAYNGNQQTLTNIDVTNLVDGQSFGGLTYLATGKTAGTYPGAFTGDASSLRFYTDDTHTTDVTGSYNVTSITPGTLVITAAAPELAISSQSNAQFYSGSPFRYDYYTVKYNGITMPVVNGKYVLPTGDSITVTSTATAVTHVEDVAAGNNTFNYELQNATNYDLTGRVTLTYGTLTINPRPVTLTSRSDSKVYDGTPLTNENLIEGGYGFVGDEGLEYSNFAAPVNVGTYPNTFDYAWKSNTKETDYTLNLSSPGTLTITKAACVVVANDTTRFYGEENPNPWNYHFTGLASTDTEASLRAAGLLTGEPAFSTAATQYSVPGTYDIDATVNTLASSNYDITADKGTLTIAKRAITIKAATDSVIYDGLDHTLTGLAANTFNIGSDVFTISGLTASVTGITVGEYVNAITGTAVITNASSEDVTTCFDITTEDGMLKIKPADLTITINDSKTYDGTKLVANYSDATVSTTGLVSGDALTAGVVESYAANANTYQYSASNVSITTPFATTNGISNYKVNYNITLDITPLTGVVVTVTGHEGTTQYSGYEQRVTGYDLAFSSTLYNKSCMSFSGDSIANGRYVGNYPMGLAETDFANVSTNFTGVTFNVTDGSLTITANAGPIQVMASSSTKQYDGTPLTDARVTYTGTLMPGDTLIATTAGSRTLVGESDNVVTSYKIMRNVSLDPSMIHTGLDYVVADYTRDVTSEYTFGSPATLKGTLRIIDTVRPTFVRPTDYTTNYSASCLADTSMMAAGTPVVTENYPSVTFPTVTYRDGAKIYTCGSSYYFDRVWRVVDSCGNVATSDSIQRITVNDNTAPVLAGTWPSNITGQDNCLTTRDISGLKSDDDIKALYEDCSTITVTHEDVVTGHSCGWMVTRTYTITDACGNAVETSPTMSVSGSDLSAPVLSGTWPENITGQNNCLASADASALLTDAQVAALYNDCSTITVTHADATSGDNCGWTITRTYTIKDSCDNSTTNTMTVSGSDQEKPVLKTGKEWPADVTGQDNCLASAITSSLKDDDFIKDLYEDCTDVTVSHIDATTGNDCNWSVTRTYTIADACSNSFTKTMSVSGGDHAAPTMQTGKTWPADITNQNNCMASAVTTSLKSDDDIKALYEDCSEITVTHSDASTGDDCDWTVTRTYTITDACGNAVSPAPTMSISGKDQTSPVLDGTWPANVTGQDNCLASADLSAMYTDAAVMALYTDCSEITVSHTDATTGNDCDWTVTRTYTITDACGNSTTNAMSISGGAHSAPVITGTWPANVTGQDNCIASADLSALYTDAAVKGLYSGCSTITVTHTDATTGDDCGWTVTRTYTVADACGNAVSPNPTMSISGSDQSAPVLTGTWPANVTGQDNCLAGADLSALYTDAAVMALYTDCGTITVTHTDATSGDDCGWTITRTYTIADACGNNATNAMSISGSDQTAPVFSAPADITICRVLPTGAIDANVTLTGEPTGISDNCSAIADITVTWSDLDTLPANDNVKRIIRREWKATDACGNISTLVQNITVLPAILPSNTTLTCPDDIDITMWYNACDTALSIGSATYTTEVSGVTISMYNNAPASGRYPEGTNIVTWTIEDECGFTLTCDQYIVVHYPPCGTATDSVADFDGINYSSVRIGCQCWTGENLRSTHYTDGSDIADYSNYANDPANDPVFGKLYSWYSASKLPENDNSTAPVTYTAPDGSTYVQGICPDGWALPTADQYITLFTTAVGSDRLRDTTAGTWLPGYEGTLPTTGFKARGAGFYDRSISRYTNLLGETFYWCSETTTERVFAPCAVISFYCPEGLIQQKLRDRGQSVRCIRMQ